MHFNKLITCTNSVFLFTYYSTIPQLVCNISDLIFFSNFITEDSYRKQVEVEGVACLLGIPIFVDRNDK